MCAPFLPPIVSHLIYYPTFYSLFTFPIIHLQLSFYSHYWTLFTMFHNCPLYSDVVIPFTVWDTHNIFDMTNTLAYIRHIVLIHHRFDASSPITYLWSFLESCIILRCSSQESALVALPWHLSRFAWDWRCFCIFHRNTISTFLQCSTNICWTPPLSQFVVVSHCTSPCFRWVALLTSLAVLASFAHFQCALNRPPPPQFRGGWGVPPPPDSWRFQPMAFP